MTTIDDIVIISDDVSITDGKEDIADNGNCSHNIIVDNSPTNSLKRNSFSKTITNTINNSSISNSESDLKLRIKMADLDEMMKMKSTVG